MDVGTISMRYALGLLDYARRHGVQEDVFADAMALLDAFGLYPALRRVLDNKLLDARKKMQIVGDCIRERNEIMSEGFSRLVALVIARQREELLPLICLDVMEVTRRQMGLLDVRVTTAVPMDENLRALMIRRLERMTGKTVNVLPRTDPAIIGGYVLRWDTYRLDRSIAGKLKKIENDLRNGRE